MTMREHFELSQQYTQAALAALHKMNESGRFDNNLWHEYKTNSRLHNKHYGIYRMMVTKHLKSLDNI